MPNNMLERPGMWVFEHFGSLYTFFSSTTIQTQILNKAIEKGLHN